MIAYYFPILLTVTGLIIYHVSQKSIPKDMNPFVAIGMVFLLASSIMWALALAVPNRKSILESIRETNWAIVGLGVAIVGTEIGFLLAYRFGWKISLANLLANVAAGALLVPIGLLLFREELSWRDLVGIVFFLAGLICIVRD